MAGSEKTGYENATDHLLENAYYIVTPPEGLDQSGSETGNIPPKYAENANRIIAVAQTVGAIPLVLDYREHDKVVAAISHLPHLVASSLVNLVKDADSPAGTMKRVAAGGFKDITRIASSSPEMWEQEAMRVMSLKPPAATLRMMPSGESLSFTRFTKLEATRWGRWLMAAVTRSCSL